MRSISLVCIALAPLAAWAEDAPQAPEAPASQESEQAPLPDVARIGTQRITGNEFQQAMEYRLYQESLERGEQVFPDAVFRRAVLEDMINARIISVLARSAGIEVDPARVEEEFALGRASLSSEEAYQEYLAHTGMTEEELREEIRERLRREAYIEQRTGDIVVTEEQVREEYEHWLREGLLERPEPTYDFAHIVMRAAPDDEESFAAAEQRLRTAWEQIREGADFGEVARAVSEDPGSARRGGVYEEATLDLVLPEIAERLQTMDPGVVSNPFRTRFGWHTMKVIGVNEPGTVSYEKIRGVLKERIETVLRQERLEENIRGAWHVLDIEIFHAAAHQIEPETTEAP